MNRIDAADFELPDFIEASNEDERSGAGSTLPQDLFPLGLPGGASNPSGPRPHSSLSGNGSSPAVHVSVSSREDFSPTLPPEMADAASSHGAANSQAVSVQAVQLAAAAQAIVAGHGAAGRLPTDGPKPKRVLVVDDDLTARLYMRSRLMLRGNVQLFEASSGPEGLKILQSQPAFDAVLLDVDMGIQNGFEVCKAVRHWVRSQGGPQPMVYIISSRSSMLDRMRAKMAGADAFLSKPPMPAELATLLARL